MSTNGEKESEVDGHELTVCLLEESAGCIKSNANNLWNEVLQHLHAKTGECIKHELLEGDSMYLTNMHLSYEMKRHYVDHFVGCQLAIMRILR